MPKFSYTAIDTSGKQKSGSLEGVSQDVVAAQIKNQGLYLTNIIPVQEEKKQGWGKAKAKPKAKKVAGRSSFAGARKKPLTIGKVVNQKGLTVFTRQLATLIQAGLPLLRSLEVLVRQEKNPSFKYVLEEVSENVRSGNTFSDGLMQHPKVF
ncbi:MAG: type II secretion system F family protein, partial [Opitutales bacterium]